MAGRLIRAGVVGVGSIGSLHARVYTELPRVKLEAVCDIDRARAAQVARRLGCRAVQNLKALRGAIDVASVAVPTNRHHAVATALIGAGIHVLVEKPIATSLREADDLLARARRRGVTLQVGHIERFNAAMRAAHRLIRHPRFIEAHRLSPYPFRGTDVSVILDVMIHDLDLVLALTHRQPSRIEAIGVPILSPSEDLANVRLQFPSGCVANLTASRVSDETMRRLRVFQEDSYLSIDYVAQSVELAHTTGSRIARRSLRITPRQSLQEELAEFLNAVRTRRTPRVSGEEAREALRLALAIEQACRRARRRWTAVR